MNYDDIIIGPHADDAETQMGGTIAKLVYRGHRILLVALTKGEPTAFAFAVDVSDVYDRKRRALSVYRSSFREDEDRLLTLYETEDRYFGRLFGVMYAEIFRSASALLVDDPTVFRPGLQS